MSNHLTPQDQITLKINEIIGAINTINMHGHGIVPIIEPLTLAPWLRKGIVETKEVKYPEYSKSAVDHSTLGG